MRWGGGQYSGGGGQNGDGGGGGATGCCMAPVHIVDLIYSPNQIQMETGTLYLENVLSNRKELQDLQSRITGNNLSTGRVATLHPGIPPHHSHLLRLQKPNLLS